MSKINDYFPEDPPRFAIGQLVRHHRYDYRGLIVDFDVCCKADDQWYENNRTQPDREQPWYHVLIDGSTAVTYAAQANLKLDTSNQPIHHPLVPHLFTHFDDGWYERNDRQWPGWEASPV